MKRSFLTALGLEKATIDQILDENGNDLELQKEKHTEAMTALKTEVSGLKEQLAKMPEPDGEDWKSKAGELKEQIKTLQADHKVALEAKGKELTDFQDKLATENRAKSVREALFRHLKADGAYDDEDVMTALAGKFDLSIVELEGDAGKETIKGWEELAKPVKEASARWFGKEESKGAKAATPPRHEVGNKDPFISGFDEN